jgi:hypothetical protein
MDMFGLLMLAPMLLLLQLLWPVLKLAVRSVLHLLGLLLQLAVSPVKAAAEKAAAEKAAHDAIQERQRGNAKLSQDLFLKALSHGASKSDPHLTDLQEWLFHENVRSEVSAAADSGDLYKVEAGIALAVKCKYPDDRHLDSLVALRKPLLQEELFKMACAQDGGALDQRTSTIFLDRLRQLCVESTGDLSSLAEGDFAGIPLIKVRNILPLLRRIVETAASESEAAYSRFMTSCPVTVQVKREVWTKDAYAIILDNGQPLRGPSPVDMWSDSYPPAAVDPRDWQSVRDGLHEKGKSLGGARGSVGNLVYRASLALNLMQHRYKSDLSVIGNQGRLFVERALGVFIPAAALEAAAADAAAANRHLEIAGKIRLMDDGHYTSREVVAACHKLRQYGNRTDHDEGDDLKPEEKPDVIKNVFIVAKALLNKVTT